MIAEIFPEAYDAKGRKISRPDSPRKGLRSTLPMGRYVSQPLTVKCQTIFDIRNFLLTCKYVSDEEQFGRRDYWQPPEEFERTRKGDCDCFALWTWRQLLTLGFDARFVVGRAGRYGEGHAWVQFSKDGKDFLAEPTIAMVGNTLPRLSTLQYHPKFSVAWDGSKLSFYAHQQRTGNPPLRKLIAFVPDWLIFWTWVWVMTLVFAPYSLCRRLIQIATTRYHRRLEKL